MEKNNRSFGAKGEDIALTYLKDNNYKIIERNFRFSRLGEIDIIAYDGEYTCFIEVKTRKNKNYGTPSEAVGRKKQANIKKLASVYLVRYPHVEHNVRFDVVEIYIDGSGNKSINLIKNAF